MSIIIGAVVIGTLYNLAAASTAAAVTLGICLALRKIFTRKGRN